MRVRAGAPAAPAAPGPVRDQDYTGTASAQGGAGGGVGDGVERVERAAEAGGAGQVPVDRWNLLYLTLILHGVGTLMPWNIFINAKTVSTVSPSSIFSCSRLAMIEQL